MMVSGLQHGFDPKLPGDKTHTTLMLATPTAFSYKRDTLSIFANVVKATHGGTRGGIARLGRRRRRADLHLQQPPLTFLSAATPPACDHVASDVNDVAWHETDTSANQGPKDEGSSLRPPTTATPRDLRRRLTGARLPTGLNNMAALPPRDRRRGQRSTPGRSACC